MAQYAADCAPARTILVEHDITFDLSQQFWAWKTASERRNEISAGAASKLPRGGPWTG